MKPNNTIFEILISWDSLLARTESSSPLPETTAWAKVRLPKSHGAAANKSELRKVASVVMGRAASLQFYGFLGAVLLCCAGLLGLGGPCWVVSVLLLAEGFSGCAGGIAVRFECLWLLLGRDVLVERSVNAIGVVLVFAALVSFCRLLLC
ncbi:hypothetical protein U1Q18_023381 [Sarracenia purpurea var. burkii]